MDKIVKYEVKLSVPQSQVSQHQKKFENILHTAINKGLKGTDLVSVVKVTKWGSQSTTTKEDTNELVHDREGMEKEEILDLPTTTYTRETGSSCREEPVEFVWNCEQNIREWIAYKSVNLLSIRSQTYNNILYHKSQVISELIIELKS